MNDMNDIMLSYLDSALVKPEHKLTQAERVLRSLIRGNHIDGISAVNTMYIYRLSAVIKNLRDMGFVIYCTTRYKSRLGIYYIKPEHRQRYLTTLNEARGL
jgi:hypothetical protein